MSNNSIIIQGSFPGGRPHSTVLINSKNDYLSIAVSGRTTQAFTRHPNNLIMQLKTGGFKRENLQAGGRTADSNTRIYPLNIARLNFQNKGCPLEDDLLQLYKGVLKTNLSNVKIHDGGGEAETLGAVAFTMGNDIYFAAGRYNPYLPQGQRLLGHELTHVIQQKEGRVNNQHNEGMVVVYNPVLEAEAENIGIYTERLLRQNNIIQRMQDSSSSSSSVTVDHVTVIRGHFDTEVLAEVKRIIAAAYAAGGGPSAIQHPSMKMLIDFMASEKVNKPSSQGTFGVGGSGYFKTTLGMYTVGSQAFGSQMAEVSKTPESGVSVHPEFLGNRESCVHAEVALMMEVPGVHSILTTQDACIFCYGLMASRDYTHQQIRSNPFPQKWTHDYMGFKLSRVNPSNGWVKNVMQIDWGGKSGFYTVEE